MGFVLSSVIFLISSGRKVDKMVLCFFILEGGGCFVWKILFKRLKVRYEILFSVRFTWKSLASCEDFSQTFKD